MKDSIYRCAAAGDKKAVLDVLKKTNVRADAPLPHSHAASQKRARDDLVHSLARTSRTRAGARRSSTRS